MPKNKIKLPKVLLIQPPAFTNNFRTDLSPNVPLGICYIGAMLEKHGYEVEILDAFIDGWDQEERISSEMTLVGLSHDQIKSIIAEKKPDIVGISSMFTMQRENAHRVASSAKEVNRAIKVIMGGAHPTAAPEMVLKDENVDAVVLAEGDNTIIPLLEALTKGTDLGAVDGIGYRDSDGKQIIHEKTMQIPDIDSLPFPARHLVPMEKYFKLNFRHGGINKRDRATSMISSRGCQYYCNFCTAFKVFTRTPRIRSVDSVIAEIDHLVQTYGVNEIYFEDDQLLAKRKHTIKILDKMIERNYNLAWDTPNGISSWILNEEVIQKMKQSGCYRVNLAIESGNQWVLENIINKPVKLELIPEIVRLIRKYDMEVGTFIVVGNIGDKGVETLDQVSDSFRFARKLGVRPFVSYLTPYPGAEVLRVAEDNNYLISGFKWEDLVITKQNITTPLWTPEELNKHVEMELGLTLAWYVLKNPGQLFVAWKKNRHIPLRFLGMASHSLKAMISKLYSLAFPAPVKTMSPPIKKKSLYSPTSTGTKKQTAASH